MQKPESLVGPANHLEKAEIIILQKSNEEGPEE